MKIEKLSVGQVVWSVERRKMGNTTLSTTSVFSVRITAIDPERRWVEASWNSNPPRRFYSRAIGKWKAKKPVMVTGAFGSQRLATKAEAEALKKEDSAGS